MIKLKIKALDLNSLSKFLSFIKRLFKFIKIKTKQVSFPIKTKRICVLKSPHVNKKAQQHFKFVVHSQILFLENLTKKTLTTLILNKPKHIKVEIKKE
jgi:small subunit ribosomal protein S10